MVTTESPAARRRTSLPRALAPDVARGVMLLLIALAHAPAMAAAPPAAIDVLASGFKALVADNQARDLFILLFGYGMGQLLARNAARGTDPTTTRRQLRRRGLVLLALGLAHNALLVPLDIIAVYGAALLILTPLVTARDKVLLWTAATTLPISVALLTLGTARELADRLAGRPTGMAPLMADTYAAHVVSDLATWVPETLLSVLIVAPGMALGIWAARRRLLDDPAAHAGLLRRVAVVGISGAVVLRLPLSLAVVGVPVPAPEGLLAVAHTLGGWLGGAGLAGLIAVVLLRGGAVRGGPVSAALAALGRRSLTFYVGQSLVWLVLFYPFALDLAPRVGTAGALGIGAATWLASLGIAVLLERLGRSAPLEWMVRRFVYGRG